MYIFTVKPWVRSFKLFARVGDELLEDTIVVSQTIAPTGEVKGRHTVDLHLQSAISSGCVVENAGHT